MQSNFFVISIIAGTLASGVLLSPGLRLLFEKIQRHTRLRKERAAARRREGFQKSLKMIQFYLEADGDAADRGPGRRIH
jgi:hypothetical protein